MGSMGGSSSKSSSKPLTPKQVQGYYTQLDANSGGRLADFALNGTQPTQYNPLGAAGQVSAPQAQASNVGYQPMDFSARLQAPTVAPAATVAYQGMTPEQVTALGGLGALREQQARRGTQQTLAQYAADPSLSTFQKFRADQLERQDLGATLDALAGEREAAITQMLADQSGKTLTADLANQAALNQTNQFGAGLGLDFQRLLGGLTDSEQGRVLQAALADQSAANQTSQFNAGQQATADQFNVATALTEAQRKYMADAANAGLSSEDMQALARIFFGGMGSSSSSGSSSPMFSGGDLVNGATLGALATGLITI